MRGGGVGKMQMCLKEKKKNPFPLQRRQQQQPGGGGRGRPLLGGPLRPSTRGVPGACDPVVAPRLPAPGHDRGVLGGVAAPGTLPEQTGGW